MPDKKFKITEVEYIAKEFVAVLDEIFKRENIRFNWRDIICNRTSLGSNEKGQLNDRRGLLYRHHKKGMAFDSVARLHPLIEKSLEIFRIEKEKTCERIKPFDEELSKRLKYFNIPKRSEFLWLLPIATMLNKNRDEGISYIKNNYELILKKFETISNKKIAFELRRLVMLMKGDEVSSLNQCISDMERWHEYTLKRGIGIAPQRLALYLKGGKDEITGETYFGIASYFKDANLVKAVLEKPSVKNLLTYRQQMKFFDDVDYFVAEALTRAKGFYQKGDREFRVNDDNNVDSRKAGSRDRWQAAEFNASYVSNANGFKNIKETDDSQGWSLFIGTENKNNKDGFIYNLRKGQKYIDMILNKFGNHEFASFLDATEQKFHESPKDWYRELMQFKPKLRYYISYNVEIAKQELTALFNAKKSQLFDNQNENANQLQNLLNKLIGESAKLKQSTKRDFRIMLTKYRKKMLKLWENEKTEYERKEDSTLLHLSIFKDRSEKVLDKIDRRKKYRKYIQVLNYSLNGDKYLSQAFKKITANENKEFLLEALEGKVYYTLYKRAQLAKSEDDLYDEIETIDEKDVEELKNLITIGNKIILPNLNKLLRYINDKINEQFLAEATKRTLQQYATEAEQKQAA